MNTEKSMTVQVTFSEVELAGEVKSFVSFNANSCEGSLKETILAFDDDELLKVTKNIASPIKIIQVQKITEELLEKAL